MSAVKSTLQCYADAVLHEQLTQARAQATNEAYSIARNGRQALWSVVKREMSEGKLKPGIHSVGNGNAIIVSRTHDYPSVLPLFTSHEG